MSGNRLCAKCQEIISKGPDKSVQENDHHSNNKALLQAVEQDCYVCSWTLRDYRSRSSNRRQKPHIVHHTTYMWENKRIRYRASDVLEFELYCGVVERHVIGGKVYSPITFQQREVASFFNSTLAIALDILLPTPLSNCGLNTCLLSLLNILLCYIFSNLTRGP